MRFSTGASITRLDFEHVVETLHVRGSGARRRGGRNTWVLGRLALLQQAGFGDGLGDGLLLARGHQMGAGDAVDLRQLLQQLDADLAALGALIAGSLQPLDDGVGICTPKRFSFIQRADLAEASGPMPTMTKSRSNMPWSRSRAR